MSKGVLSELDGKLLRISPAYIDPPVGGYHWQRFAIMDLPLRAPLPLCPLTPTYFYVTFIGMNYYAFWPNSEELYQCLVI